MKDYIGLPLETVTKILKEKNIEYVVKKNNSHIMGDTILVTNVKKQNNIVVLIVGEFIFDIIKVKNDKKDWFRF